MQNQQITQEPDQNIDIELRPNAEGASQQVSFDRYEIIGLLLLMYGWWKILSHFWLVAVTCCGVGWLLAFATGPKRDGFIRIVAGISTDVLKLTCSLIRKTSSYLDQKRIGNSDADNR